MKLCRCISALALALMSVMTMKGTMYYVTDLQGNNVAVVGKNGDSAQQTIYYPDGEPTIEPTGQRTKKL